jgi:hypothetical protein
VSGVDLNLLALLDALLIERHVAAPPRRWAREPASF